MGFEKKGFLGGRGSLGDPRLMPGPEQYTKPVHKNMKILANARAKNEVGWSSTEMEAENDFRAFEVFTGIYEEPGIFSFSNSTISCTSASCVEFHSQGVPCIHLTFLLMNKIISPDELPSFYSAFRCRLTPLSEPRFHKEWWLNPSTTLQP